MKLPLGIGHPLVRSLFGIGVGAMLFLVMMVELPASPAGAAAEVWAVDRDANELVGLDGDGFVVQRVDVRAPVAVAAGGAAVHVASSVEGWALGEHALVEVPMGGRPRVVAAGLGPVLDLELLPDGGALLVELASGGPARVLRTPGGAAVGGAGLVLGAELEGAGWGAGRLVEAGGALGTEVLVGDWGGGLSLVRDGVLVATRQLGGELGDIAPGPGGTWFVLEVAAPGRLHLVDQNLAVLWTVEHGIAAAALAPVAGQERVWLVDSTEPLARRFGPGGALELEVPILASDAADVVAHPDGGAWIATPGAVLRLDASGNSVPGQGGFDQLVGIAR
ncbi:MAG: hypothetical protein P1V81_15910 [Planctomycetota bacterium]|nr:hypothetical protein [Planctomycetota bacterium]